MKYVLLTHARHKTASVLESTVELTDASDVLALIESADEVSADTIDAISAGEPGHHFAENADFTYQVVVKAP